MQTLTENPTHDSAEARFLLECIRAGSSPLDRLGQEESVRTNLDWPRWYEMAVRQGMITRLETWMRSPAFSQVPRPYRDKIRRNNVTNAGRGLFLTAKLCEVVRILKDRNITAVPFKGPALSVGLYNDATRRSYLDLDLMVRRQDAPEAIRVLKTHGFRPEYDLDAAQEAALIRNQYDLPFTHPSENFTLELHWDIVPRHLGCRVDLPSMWERLETIRLGHYDIPSFAPEDHLVLLCIHAGKHMWHRLAWICDVADLIKCYSPMNWDHVMEQARNSRCEKAVTLGLWLAWDLLNTPLPFAVMAWLRKDPSLGALGRRIRTDLFQKAGLEPGPFEYFGAQWRLRDRWRDRIRFSLRFFLTPTIGDLRTLSLPREFYLLYYAIRPVRLLLKSRPR